VGKPDLVRVNKTSRCVTSLCTGGTDEPEVVQNEHLPSLLGQVNSQLPPTGLKDAKGGQPDQMDLQYSAELPATLVYNPVVETYDEVQVHVEDMPATLENDTRLPRSPPVGVAEEAVGGARCSHVGELKTPASQSTLSLCDTIVSSAPVQPEPIEFTIEIMKDVNKHGAGLEIQALDDMLIILKLGDGPIREWNASHDTSLTVSPGDRIVAVNDVNTDVEALLAAIKSLTSLKIRVRRPAYFRIHIDKAGKGLGAALLVNTDPLGMLTIHQLRDGALKDWNAENPNQQLRSGDRILWVNGVTGKPNSMIAKVKKEAQLDMVLLRLR